MKRLAFWIAGISVLWLIGTALILAIYVSVVGARIDERFAQLRAARGSHFYALYPALKPGQRFPSGELENLLLEQGYFERKGSEDLAPSEYRLEKEAGLSRITLSRPPFTGPGHALDALKVRLTFEPLGGLLHLKEIHRLPDLALLPELEFAPKKIGSFFAGRIRTQSYATLSDIPASMRLAVMAIEDVHFLEHTGVSLRSTLRALWRDLKARRWVEGGSTLTQQLMKNLFFSREKSLARKLKEAIYALVAESRQSKETILEGYLNEIYLGQWGPHEIHGVSEGAQIFFGRPIGQLSLPQSATLAAIIQAPNAQDPHRHPDRTLKRRNLVLKKMLDANFILPEEYQVAIQAPLGIVPLERNLNDAAYFIELVMNRLPPDIKGQLEGGGLSIHTTLNPYFQSVASRALGANLARLKKISTKVQDLEKKGRTLQSALIAVDVKNCAVVALQGGLSYRTAQFNRVLQGMRQPGSLFKPFVVLTALSQSSSADPVTPLTEIEDAPFEWKYDKQVWKPKNYDPVFRGKVTVRQILEDSINTPTARLAQRVTIAAITETLSKAGIRTPLPVLPSLSLGSSEVTPFELAEAFTTLANLGRSCPLRAVSNVFDSNGNKLTDMPPAFQENLPAAPTFQTVHLMKGAFTRGTARSAQSSGLNLSHFSGKTGTTNEAKDAWFVGFSPTFLALVWVGYDEQEKVGLTGAVAALPLWVDFIKGTQPFTVDEDFTKPEGVEPFDVDLSTRSLSTPRCPEIQVEYFAKGTEPKQTCPAHP